MGLPEYKPRSAVFRKNYKADLHFDSVEISLQKVREALSIFKKNAHWSKYKCYRGCSGLYHAEKKAFVLANSGNNFETEETMKYKLSINSFSISSPPSIQHFLQKKNDDEFQINDELGNSHI